jgi:lipoate-protein ligase A
MNDWRLIISPEISGFENMQTDIKMFEDHENGLISSTLRIYSWQPKCISLGYSQKIEEEIDADKASQLGWDIVKRPTGGGIVFHNEAEITYSIVTLIDNPILPKGLVPSYIRISEAIVVGLNKIGINANIARIRRSTRDNLCFSYPAEYEIVLNGKKIVGSAQKRGKRTLLQQGSIFVCEIEDEVFFVLKQPFERPKAVSISEIIKKNISFAELSIALIDGFKEELGIEFD